MGFLSASDPIVGQFRSLVANIGTAALSQLYPNDFETYFCALELVDSRDRVVDFFVFPVMPSVMRESNMSLLNVKKTAGGVTVITTNQFIPIDMTIEGNFGRQFKFLVGQQIVDASAISFSTQGGVFTKKQGLNQGAQMTGNAIFNSMVKTGYGCFQILKAICAKSGGLDEDGNPYHLYMYNPTLNAHYLIEVMSFVTSQDDKQNNMLHQYQITMKLIAPMEGLKRDGDKDSLTKAMQYAIIGKAMNQGAASLKNKIRIAINQNAE